MTYTLVHRGAAEVAMIGDLPRAFNIGTGWYLMGPACPGGPSALGDFESFLRALDPAALPVREELPVGQFLTELRRLTA